VQIAVPVGLNLEHQTAERFIGIGTPNELVVGLFGIRAFDRQNVGGAGQVQRHRVQHRLHANPVQSRAAQHRHEGAVPEGLLQAARHFLVRQRGLGGRAPVHHTLAAVDEALFV